MLTGAEVVDKPPLSVAMAVSVFVPTSAFVHTKLYGAVMTVPNWFARSGKPPAPPCRQNRSPSH